MVLTIERFIWRELRKVIVQDETDYGLTYTQVTVGQIPLGHIKVTQSDG